MIEYRLTRLSQNPTTGMTTWRLPAAAAQILDGWHDLPAQQVARHGRRAPVADTLTFRAGGGYDVIDADLLGGRGDGDTRRHFEDATGVHITY